MNAERVPAVLREQLGAEATDGLLQLFDGIQHDWRADVIAACTDRFERRVVEEISKLRVDMSGLESSLRHDLARVESTLRQDMGKMESGLRQDMGKMEAAIRQDIVTGRFELLKWCFLFWIGQVVAITGITGVMLRLYRP